jgi:hypothetical protein
MHRIDTSGNLGGQFTDGDPTIGQQATVVDDDFMNAVQEEIAGTVEKAGIALNKASHLQLFDALMAMTETVPGGRLSIASGVPVSAADVSAIGQMYYTPHKHNRIRLYDGTRWRWYSFAELTQLNTDATKSPAAVAANSNYDLFIWDDAGTVRLSRGPAWTSDTARGAGAGTTELETFGGSLVNKIAIANGPAARRGLYVGTARSDGTLGFNDTRTLRHVWNHYNRVRRSLVNPGDLTSSWNYTTAAFRQAGGIATNQVDIVIGVAEDPVDLTVRANAKNTATLVRFAVGVGVDSTSVADVNDSIAQHGMTAIANGEAPASARYVGIPGIGRHFLVWLEYSAATGTTTWIGNVAPSIPAGMIGYVNG